MTRRTCLQGAAVATLMSGCRGKSEPKSEAAADLLGPAWLAAWEKTDVNGAGPLVVEKHQIRLGVGAPMTCMKFSAWAEAKLPTIDYVIEMEARRVEGNDFFSALTFPVGELTRCVSFINGGWGGSITGLSNIDSQTAAENRTASEQRYTQGQWHHFRIEVRANEIAVRMDQRIIIRTALEGHLIDVRPGDIESCKPFGLASYESTGEIRRLDVSRLPPE
jgi:hypothetical protein